MYRNTFYASIGFKIAGNPWRERNRGGPEAPDQWLRDNTRGYVSLVFINPSDKPSNEDLHVTFFSREAVLAVANVLHLIHAEGKPRVITSTDAQRHLPQSITISPGSHDTYLIISATDQSDNSTSVVAVGITLDTMFRLQDALKAAAEVFGPGVRSPA